MVLSVPGHLKSCPARQSLIPADKKAAHAHKVTAQSEEDVSVLLCLSIGLQSLNYSDYKGGRVETERKIRQLRSYETEDEGMRTQ